MFVQGLSRGCPFFFLSPTRRYCDGFDQHRRHMNVTSYRYPYIPTCVYSN